MGRAFLRIFINTNAVISWCSLWALLLKVLTVIQPPISPCRTPRRCSRPRASWGRCQRRARLLESSFCNCYLKWSRSLSFLRRNSRDTYVANCFTDLKKQRKGWNEHENGRYQRRHPCRSSWWLLRRITFPGSKDNRHSVRGGAERKEISACAAGRSKFRSCRQQANFLSQKRRLAGQHRSNFYGKKRKGKEMTQFQFHQSDSTLQGFPSGPIIQHLSKLLLYIQKADYCWELPRSFHSVFFKCWCE